MNQLTLHPVKRATKRSNRYCGPSALSILTGLDTEDTARLIRSVSGQSRVVGTSEYAMRDALVKLGFTMRMIGNYGGQPAKQRPTLAQWSRLSRGGTTTYLMSVGRHWAIVQGRRYACGIVRQPVTLKGCVKWRARVRCVWVIDLGVTGMKHDAIPAKPTPPPRDPDAATAKELAAYYGIKLEAVGCFDRLRPADDGVYVYPPTGLYDEDSENDPLSGERIGYSWGEVLESVNVYVAALKAKQAASATVEVAS